MQIHLPSALDASEQALEEVFRHTPVGVVLTDLHGTILDANVAFCTMLLRERELVLGQPFLEFILPEERALAGQTIARLRSEEASSVESVRRWVSSAGRVVTTKLTASVVRSKDGEAICGIAFVEDIGKRLEMEKALRDSEGRYRRVVEDQTELIVRCLPDGTRTFVNEAYCRYNSAPADELLGTSFFSCIPAGEREHIERKFSMLTPDRPAITDEHRVAAPDGSLRWHRWTDRGIFDAAGALVEVQAVGSDITEERDSRDLLRRSEDDYRRLYNALPVAVWETDFGEVIPEMLRRGLDTPAKILEGIEKSPGLFRELASFGRLVRANDAALAMAGGSTPEEVFAWMAARYTREAEVAYMRAAAALLMGEASSVDFDLPLCTPEGGRLDFLQRLSRSPDWPLDAKVIAIVLNVTERRRTERDLVHRKQILEEAEVLARTGSWEWDPATNEIFGSAGFWRIFEGKAEARFATVEGAVRCFHERDREAVVSILESLRTTGREYAGAGRDMMLVHPDGTELTGRGVAFAEQNAAGETVRIFGVVQDVTEQRRVEAAAQREREALTRADKMISLGVLVSGVAHEVNNPNHSIMLNSALLRDAWKAIVPVVDESAAHQGTLRIGNLPWDEVRVEAAAMIDDIEHAAERIRGIVNELRNFALDHDPGERRAVSINDVVTSSLRLLGNHIRKATTRFSTSLAPDLPPVSGNQRRLEQVLVNLVINACQALESPDRSIAIETGRTSTHVFARVIDEGTGITSDDLRKIRDPFFTTKRSSGGSGLGLAVSDRIAQEHGGELTFQSEPGRGTTATLSIPSR